MTQKFIFFEKTFRNNAKNLSLLQCHSSHESHLEGSTDQMENTCTEGTHSPCFHPVRKKKSLEYENRTKVAFHLKKNRVP